MSTIPFRAAPTLLAPLSSASTAASAPALVLALEWPHSRAQRFFACPRAAYYATELAREGWQPNASEDARTARRLKTLTALPLVVGLELHERAAEIARAIRAGEPLPTLVQMRERTSHQMNHVWVASRDPRAEWMKYPTRVPMLRECYYGALPSPEQLAKVRDRVEHGLISLRKLAYWGEVGAASPENIALGDKFASYTLPALEADLSAIVERARRESSGYAMTHDRTKCRDCPFAEVCELHEGTSSGPAPLDAAA